MVKRRKTKPRKKIYIQNISPSRWRVSDVCRKVSEKRATQRYALAKTPREDPEFCLGRVRLGRDTKTFYIAVRQWQRNPHYTGPGYDAGPGMHLRYYWRKLYDQRTGKPFKVTKISKKDFLEGKLFVSKLRSEVIRGMLS